MTQPSYQQTPQQPVTLVTFRSERLLRHALILFLVLAYISIVLAVLGFLLGIAGLSTLTP